MLLARVLSTTSHRGGYSVPRWQNALVCVTFYARKINCFWPKSLDINADDLEFSENKSDFNPISYWARNSTWLILRAVRLSGFRNCCRREYCLAYITNRCHMKDPGSEERNKPWMAGDKGARRSPSEHRLQFDICPELIPLNNCRRVAAREFRNRVCDRLQLKKIPKFE